MGNIFAWILFSLQFIVVLLPQFAILRFGGRKKTPLQKPVTVAIVFDTLSTIGSEQKDGERDSERRLGEARRDAKITGNSIAKIFFIFVLFCFIFFFILFRLSNLCETMKTCRQTRYARECSGVRAKSGKRMKTTEYKIEQMHCVVKIDGIASYSFPFHSSPHIYGALRIVCVCIIHFRLPFSVGMRRAPLSFSRRARRCTSSSSPSRVCIWRYASAKL